MAIGIGAGYWKSGNAAPVYRSLARMMVGGKIDLPEGAVYSEELSNFYGTQIELMQSGDIQHRASTRLEGAHPELRAVPVGLSVAQQRGTSLFILTATSSDPQYGQAFLDSVMVEYIQFKRELRETAAIAAITAVSSQLLPLDKELKAGEQELMAFQKKDNVVFLEDEGNSAGRYLIQLRQKLADLQSEADLLRLLDVDQNIQRQHSGSPKAETQSGNAIPRAETVELKGPESSYLEAKQQIQILQTNMDRLGKFLRPKHPKMIQLADQIQKQQQLISLFRDQTVAQIQNRRTGIELQIENLNGEIKEWETKALNLNQKIAEYNRLKAGVERSKALYDKLLATVQNVDVNKSLGQDVVSIMEHASAPVAFKAGLAKDIGTGAGGGFALGLGILVILGLLDDRVSSVVEIRQALDEEILAQIPREPWAGPLDVRNLETKHPMLAEACRNLRSSLLFMSFDGERPKTFLVTSSVPDEGKSTISTSLAISLAATGAKTLLIDGDLRKGALHTAFDYNSSPGLTEVLRNELTASEAIKITTCEHLHFLPRGRAATDASELYLREVTDSFLRQVYKDYEYIIFDSAPVLAKEDSASLAPKIDATLFVVRDGVASLRKSRSALEILHQRNVNVLGVIFNSATKSSPGYYYYESYGPDAAA